jgi:hypothetical protein
VRRAARTDVNQHAIIEALHRCGVSVEVIGKPVDLLVCSRGVTSLVEVKNPDRERGGDGLTKAQVEFLARWPGTVHVVQSADEAVRAVLGPEVMK